MPGCLSHRACAFLASAALLAGAASAQDPVPTALELALDTPVAAAGTLGGRPAVGVDAGGTIYVGFVASEGNLNAMRATVSTDGGKTFAAPQTLTKDADASMVAESPRVAGLSAGRAAFLWADQGIASDDLDLRVAITTDGGKSFKPRVAIDSGHATSRQSGADLMAVDDSKLAVVWIDSRAGRSDPRIYGAISADSGETWTPSAEPWATGVSGQAPLEIVTDARGKAGLLYRLMGEGDLHDPVWHQLDVGKDGLVRPKDSKRVGKEGKRWRSPPTSGPTGLSTSATGDVLCLWVAGEKDDAQLLLATSGNRGANWKPPVVLDSGGISMPERPRLAALPGDQILAAWEGKKERDEVIALVRSGDGGKTWSEPLIVPGKNAAVAARPHSDGTVIAWVAAKGGALHVGLVR